MEPMDDNEPAAEIVPSPLSRLDSPDLLKVIVDSALAGVVTMGEDGHVNGWGASAERTFGWTAAEAVGSRLSDLIVPARYREAHNEGLRRYRATGEGPVLGTVMEMEALHKDGREFPVEIRISPAAVVDGETVFIAFAHDITARRETERALAARVAEIAAAKASVEDYVRMMVHEMRQPLTVVTGYTEILLGQLAPDAPSRAELEVILEQAGEAGGMVEDLLLAARLEAGSVEPHLEPFQLAEVVRAAVARVMPRAALRRGTITAAAIPEGLRVRADRTFTRRILDNLLSNAVAYSPSAPAVDVTVDVAEDEVSIKVADQGRGIPRAFAERVFDRFARADEHNSPPGSGLGLYISRHLAERQQGTLALVSSVEGRGSIFCLCMRADRESAQRIR